MEREVKCLTRLTLRFSITLIWFRNTINSRVGVSCITLRVYDSIHEICNTFILSSLYPES